MVQGGRGTRHEPQAPGEAQVLHHRRDIKQTGAKWSGRQSERSLPPYQSARGPRTQRPDTSRTARPLGKRKSDFPDSVVLPQWAARSGLAWWRLLVPGSRGPLRLRNRVGPIFFPYLRPPQVPHWGPKWEGTPLLDIFLFLLPHSFPESSWPQAEGYKFRAGRAEVGRRGAGRKWWLS